MARFSPPSMPDYKYRAGLFSFAAALYLVALAFIFSSCQAPPPAETKPEVKEEIKLCTPRDLSLDSSGSHWARIAWDPGCPEVRIMRGFNVYLSTSSLELETGRAVPRLMSHNPEVYPGDSLGNPNRETYEFKDLENLISYYVRVRAVNSDGSFSAPTDEIKFVCRPQGIVELKESFSGEKAGFNFLAEDYCRTDALENDLYHYYKEGHDYLCSPGRLGVVHRATQLFDAGTGVTWPDPDSLHNVGDAAEKLDAKAGQNVVLVTADGHRIALYIDRFEGTSPQRSVFLRYSLRAGQER